MKKLTLIALTLLALSSCKKRYEYYCDCYIMNQTTTQMEWITVQYYYRGDLHDNCWSNFGNCTERIEEL